MESADDKENTLLNKRRCEICGVNGHNARTCKNFEKSHVSDIEETNDAEESSVNKRKCGICGLEGHNARTCLANN
ncbi:hypothetical protein F8M41_000377 [Gigaspora margarita]|uniref:CCHC-type domain-containing protein n=1 Tax=Gigaspora margarita TaxID=4874 RepID=A0A8H4AAY4_GIGMA|nr:hypothetical protein F8M41_000377 [Gigaspora margarita]